MVLLPYSATKDTILPLSKPILGSDGSEVREIFVPSGTNISVSILGTNRNPDIWGKDAYEWKPERWLSQLPASVTQARVPGAYSNLLVRSCLDLLYVDLLTSLQHDLYGWQESLHVRVNLPPYSLTI